MAGMEANIKRIARAVNIQTQMTSELWGKPNQGASRFRKSTIVLKKGRAR